VTSAYNQKSKVNKDLSDSDHEQNRIERVSLFAKTQSVVLK
jgi:hypothetical protein